MEQRGIINLLLTNFNNCIKVHGPEYTNTLLKNAIAGITADNTIVEFIILRTCSIFNTPRIRLIKNKDATALYVCMYLIKQETGMSHREIASLFDRERSTPSTAIKHISALDQRHKADIPTLLKLKRLQEEITEHKTMK